MDLFYEGLIGTDAAKQMSDQEALCRIVASCQHVMFGPWVRHHPIFIGLWKMGVLVNVGAEKHNGHGKAGAKLQEQKFGDTESIKKSE